MTAPTTYAERQQRIDNVRNMTPSQANYITSLVEARYAVDAPERVALREQYSKIRCNADVSAMIESLLQVPTLVARHAVAQANEQAAKTARLAARRPTEAGYYRNPATGELFRLSYGKDGAIISKYSETGGPRRLLTDMSQIVKGSWKRLGVFQTRMTLSNLSPGWLIDPQDLAQEFAYGFCPLHHGPLTDAVSVILGYGPTCAEREGLPWGEDVAKAKLAAMNKES